MGTCVLSQALYSDNLGQANVMDLQMLCSDVSSVLALGDARIRVHHRRPDSLIARLRHAWLCIAVFSGKAQDEERAGWLSRGVAACGEPGRPPATPASLVCSSNEWHVYMLVLPASLCMRAVASPKSAPNGVSTG